MSKFSTDSDGIERIKVMTIHYSSREEMVAGVAWAITDNTTGGEEGDDLRAVESLTKKSAESALRYALWSAGEDGLRSEQSADLLDAVERRIDELFTAEFDRAEVVAQRAAEAEAEAEAEADEEAEWQEADEEIGSLSDLAS